jgi:signal transduction histidine kinase
MAGGAVLAAAIAMPAMGVELDGGTLDTTWVLPGGDSWNAGIRSGQRVISLTHGGSLQDWRLEVRSGAGTAIAVMGLVQLQDLRSMLPVAMVSLLFAGLALGLFATRRQLAAGVALGAMALAVPVVSATNEPPMVWLVAAGVPLVGAAWLAGSSRATRSRVVSGSILGVVAIWAIAWSQALEAFTFVDALREGAVLAMVAVAIWNSTSWREWITGSASRNPPRAVDLVAVAAIGAGSVAVRLATDLPLIAIGAGVAIASAVFVLIRRPLNTLIEHILLDGLRADAAIAATEEERARLAAEIHDGPLQLLAAAEAVIRDGAPTADALDLIEDASLDLRAVSAALRPPVLDDLGLGAALAWLVDQTRTQLDADCVIASDVIDNLGTARAARLPGNVELAAFRIAQEAVSNAVRHAEAAAICVVAELGLDGVHLEVQDDGRGIREADARRARRAGRLGTSTMQRRAAAVGGTLDIRPGVPSGTVVRFDWRPS